MTVFSLTFQELLHSCIKLLQYKVSCACYSFGSVANKNAKCNEFFDNSLTYLGTGIPISWKSIYFNFTVLIVLLNLLIHFSTIKLTHTQY